MREYMSDVAVPYLASIDSTGRVEIKAPSFENQASIWGDDNRGADFILEAGSFVYLNRSSRVAYGNTGPLQPRRGQCVGGRWPR
jgi:hypothetical protein